MTIEYTNQIPKDTTGYSLPIKRTPPTAPLVAVVTSEDLLGCYTHFYLGRTQPHTTPTCPACEANMPYRWHAYLAAIDVKTGLHFLFECTAIAAEAFVTFREAYGSLRGCKFEARRQNRSPNGRILIRTAPIDRKALQLPTAPDLTKLLATLWSVSADTTQANGRNPEKRTDQIRNALAPYDPKRG